MSETLQDKDGTPVEGLPTSYDNIDEDGTVLYLDEERLRRKEQPGKPVFKNHPNGLGIKNFLVTHVSARDWNWKIILALFRKLVAWSAYMKHPETMRSKLYKRGMYFEPQEKTYSTGSVYNLNVDGPAEKPGTAAYNAAVLEQRETQRSSDEAPRKEQAAASAVDEKAHHGTTQPFACKPARPNKLVPKRRGVTIPVGATHDMTSVTVPMDLVKKAISEAHYIGGMKECLCRAGQNCQTYPHDLACLFLNMGGKVVVDHGMAVELTREEAYARVDRAAELGLVCQSLWVEVEQLIWGFRNDEMNAFLEICFCCPCCCVGFNLSKNATRDVKRRFSPVGWTAVVNHAKCTGCKSCVGHYCPQDAIHFRASDGKMVIDQENCIGCGFCRAHCPEDAIEIKQTMPMRDDVHDYFLQEGRLDIVPGRDFEDRTSSLLTKPADDLVKSGAYVAASASSAAGTTSATLVRKATDLAEPATKLSKSAAALADEANKVADGVQRAAELADDLKKGIENTK